MENILETINKAALKFLIPLSEEEMYKTIVEEGRKLIDAEHGSIFLERNGVLERVYASSPLFYEVTISKDGYVYKTYQTKKPIVGNAKNLERISPEITSLHLSSVILMPLSYKEETIGVLTIYSVKDAHFTNKELQILRLFGSMASLAIRKTELYQETKQALEIRDRFISLASHELRTPLTSINGYIQLLLNKVKDKDTVDAKWIKELHAESIRLTNLVKELLEINRVKTGQLHFTFQEVHLEKILQTASERLKHMYPERKIVYSSTLKTDNDTVIGDPDKLLQVFTAVLGNAIKFSPTDSVVRLHLAYKRPHFIISIEDEGKGIHKKEIQQIFQGFYKGIDNMQEGFGLGLLLSRHIIESHQGTIAIENGEKSGTKVVIRMRESEL